MRIEITCEDLQNYKRLDLFLVAKIQAKSPEHPDFSEINRSVLKKIFQAGGIRSEENLPLALNKMPKTPCTITLEIPEKKDPLEKGENIPLEILYEDEEIIALNKPAGLVVHPAPGNYTGTLVHALLYHCQDIRGVGERKRPGIVHRLDKGTSGAMVVAKSQRAHQKLSQMFSRHDLTRRYEALVLGKRIESSGTISSLIARNPHNRLKMTSQISRGKEAITHYQVLEYYGEITHLELTLETGRTHQIRVHLSEKLNAGILCDPLYAHKEEQKKKMPPAVKSLLSPYDYPLLHAKELHIAHPLSGKKMSFFASPSQIFSSVLDSLA